LWSDFTPDGSRAVLAKILIALMSSKIPGLHHVTAIASDPQRNLDFYVGLLGLRFVKRTVNFDDPGTYHFYLGDQRGTPGTILTFFPWPGVRRGIRGTGQIEATAFAISSGSIGYWLERLKQHHVTAEKTSTRFDEEVIRLLDPDGLMIELITSSSQAPVEPWRDSPVPQEHMLCGFHSVSVALEGYERTARLLTETFGYRLVDESGNRFRFVSADDLALGRIIDLLCHGVYDRGGWGPRRGWFGASHRVSSEGSSRTAPMARTARPSWLQRHASNRSHLFSFHLFPRTGRRAL
jgi:glyoxalase family protein